MINIYDKSIAPMVIYVFSGIQNTLLIIIHQLDAYMNSNYKVVQIENYTFFINYKMIYYSFCKVETLHFDTVFLHS